MFERDPQHTNCASQQTARLIYSNTKINLHYHLQVPTVLLSHKQTSNNSTRCPFLRRGINRDVSLHLSRLELCHASGARTSLCAFSQRPHPTLNVLLIERVARDGKLNWTLIVACIARCWKRLNAGLCRNFEHLGFLEPRPAQLVKREPHTTSTCPSHLHAVRPDVGAARHMDRSTLRSCGNLQRVDSGHVPPARRCPCSG